MITIHNHTLVQSEHRPQKFCSLWREHRQNTGRRNSAAFDKNTGRRNSAAFDKNTGRTGISFIHYSLKIFFTRWLKSSLNKPFPSCLLPLLQNESWCTTFHMEMSLIWETMNMKVNSFPYERLCTTLASGTRPDWGIPGPKPGLKAGVSVALGQVGQGMKKVGKLRPQGQPGLAWAKIGQACWGRWKKI